MTDFKIESIGNGEYDLAIVNNDFVLVGGSADTWPDELAQRIVFAVCVWYGESAFDRDVGFPWREGVFGRHPIEGIAALVNEKILGVEGVLGFNSQPVLTLDTTARKLFIVADVAGADFSIPIDITVAEPTP